MKYDLISGFADEINSDFDLQLAGLIENGMKFMEIRGVGGKNIASLNNNELIEVKAKLDKVGIKVSSIGSPIGKYKIEDDFAKHLEAFENVMAAAQILDTKFIRMFSFFIPKDERNEAGYKKYRSEVMDRLGVMLGLATKKGLVLCHENEREIYGETPANCLDIMKTFDGKIRCVFDHANFLVAGFKPYPDAYNMLKDYIVYMHIKDHGKDGIMPAGLGDGKIPETLKDLFANGFNGYLSIEPHLSVFSGLENLESKENNIVKNKFKTKEEAFKAAKGALDNILAAL